MTGHATPGARSALVVTCSDRSAGGRRPDASGEALQARLEALGFVVDRTEEHTFSGHRRFHTADGNGNRVELLASL